MYKRILLAYDGSESGQKALLDSLDIAQWSQAELHLVAVMPRLATTYAGLEGGLYIDESEEEEKKRFQGIPHPVIEIQLAVFGVEAILFNLLVQF